MASMTDRIPDHFSGAYHLPINQETLLIPTGYEPEALKDLGSQLSWVGTQLTFDRTQDADGSKLTIALSLDKSANGFYYYDKAYPTERAFTGIEIVCRSIVEVTLTDIQQHTFSLPDREFYAIDGQGVHKGVVSWLDLIAEGAQIVSAKAFAPEQPKQA